MFFIRFKKLGQLFLQIYLFALSLLLLGFFFTCVNILDDDVVSEALFIFFIASLSFRLNTFCWFFRFTDSSFNWIFHFTSYIFQLWVCIWFFPILCISLLMFFMHCIIFIIGLINSSNMTSISSFSMLIIAAFKSLLIAASGDTQFQLNAFLPQ